MQVCAGVYVFPPALSERQIRLLVDLAKEEHHGGGDGHGHGGEGHARPQKPHRVPWLPAVLWPHIRRVRFQGMELVRIDEHVRVYHILPFVGVAPHVDEDFAGPDDTTAMVSVLAYLNHEYMGGETVFRGTHRVKDEVEVGGGLVFRHDVPHEGVPVLAGERFVLKTDVFCRRTGIY